MITMPEMAADSLGKLLAEDVRRLFGSSHHEVRDRCPSHKSNGSLSWEVKQIDQPLGSNGFCRCCCRSRDVVPGVLAPY